MSIRIAKNECDSRSASYIYATSWKAAYRGIFTDQLLDDIPVDRWVDTFNRNYDTHRFACAIFSIDGRDVGAGAYGLSRSYDDKSWGEITSIYFLKEAWGKGYAEQLMNFMCARLKAMGCTKIHVWVLSENTRAQRFYEKFGFTRTGVEEPISLNGENKIDVEYAL